MLKLGKRKKVAIRFKKERRAFYKAKYMRKRQRKKDRKDRNKGKQKNSRGRHIQNNERRRDR
jgi:hypothetical protein